MKDLTPHEERVLTIAKKHPKIIQDRAEREKVAQAHGMTEKTMRNRLADLKRYGVIGVSKEGSPGEEKLSTNIEAFWRRRKLVIFNTLFFALVSVAVAFLLPKWYRSQAVIISAGAGQTPNFLSALSGLPMGNFGLSALNEDINNYIAILESRTVNEHMVHRFDLVERYDVKDVEFALEAWASNVELEATEEGSLIIGVLDKDPETARNMVNVLLQELEIMNHYLATQKGKFNRQFLEERLEQNKKDLAKNEELLRQFQMRYGAVEIPGQVLAGIEVYSQLHAQKVETEIQLKVAQATLPSNDPKTKRFEILLKELNSRLEDMMSGADGKSVLLPFEDVPDLSLKFSRLLREVETQNQIMQIILPQYEQARMEESKNVPSLQIIDEPQIALNKTKPRRALIVIASTLMALMLSSSYVIIEYRTREIRSSLRSL